MGHARLSMRYEATFGYGFLLYNNHFVDRFIIEHNCNYKMEVTGMVCKK